MPSIDFTRSTQLNEHAQNMEVGIFQSQTIGTNNNPYQNSLYQVVLDSTMQLSFNYQLDIHETSF